MKAMDARTISRLRTAYERALNQMSAARLEYQTAVRTGRRVRAKLADLYRSEHRYLAVRSALASVDAEFAALMGVR